jgi:hypothetical protein
MQALAPRATMARTWAEQMVPAPPVQKTTLLSKVCQLEVGVGLEGAMGRRRLRDGKASAAKRIAGHTKDAILPDIAHELVSLHGHGARCLPSGCVSVGVAGL